MKNQPKVLLFDIETAPAKVYTWGLYDQNIGINQVIDDGYVLCWAAKWLDEKKIMSDSIVNYPDFKKDPQSDKRIAQTMWKLLDEADIVVTHNGDNFDIKWLNTIFIKHHLPPVSTFKSIDTLKESRNSFRFLSNKLDFIARKLTLGYKINTGGFELWIECMVGDPVAWEKMVRYCRNDVKILENIYKEIRPYIKNHPNLNLYTGENGCPNCGSPRLKKEGFSFTTMSKYQRYSCLDCGKWSRDRKRLPTNAKGVVSAL